MRVDETAKHWRMSSRQVYRLIKEGLVPVTIKPRDRPILGYEIDDRFVEQVRARLDGQPLHRGAIRKILQEV